MASASKGHVSVPPGFRFHPTDEELVHYYLRKKVAYESIEMDVIRDIDLNKFEPWDLKDKCKIGTGPQNEWYLFSHKDKKYPTGSRTNRATRAGFWKATGRDKGIHDTNGKRIGMRKTLVFYTGRAPHGNKTDWIMHEYRLIDDHFHTAASSTSTTFQEDGWVVCRVFKKKHQQNSYMRGGDQQLPIITDHQTVDDVAARIQQQYDGTFSLLAPEMNEVGSGMEQKQFYTDDHQIMLHKAAHQMQLPQLISPEQSAAPPTTYMPHYLINQLDIECSHNLMKLGGASTGSHAYCGVPGGAAPAQQPQDWSILDKLLSSHQISSLDHQFYHPKLAIISNNSTASSQSHGDQHGLVSSHVLLPSLPFNYLG